MSHKLFHFLSYMVIWSTTESESGNIYLLVFIGLYIWLSVTECAKYHMPYLIE